MSFKIDDRVILIDIADVVGLTAHDINLLIVRDEFVVTFSQTINLGSYVDHQPRFKNDCVISVKKCSCGCGVQHILNADRFILKPNISDQEFIEVIMGNKRMLDI